MSVPGVTTYSATCRECPWTEPTAKPVAARRHNRATGHATTLTRTIRYEYGPIAPDVIPGQTTLDIPDGAPTP